MHHHTYTGLIGLSLVACTTIASAAPAFDHEGWTGFVRKDDIYNGCIMGKHVTNGIYFLIYANDSKVLSIGVSSSSLDKEVDEEIAGTVTFDDNDPQQLTGSMVEPDIALFSAYINEAGFEPLLRKSKQIRLTYDHSKLGLPLKGSSRALDLLWDCAGKTAVEAKSQLKQDNQNLVQKVLTGTIGIGTLDSGITGPEGWFGFMTRSPEGDKIFQTCKMDDNCKITALVNPDSEFIQSVISVEKIAAEKPQTFKRPEPVPSQSDRSSKEVPFFSKGNWGVSIVNGREGALYCVSWNFPSARAILQQPKVQQEMREAIDACTKHITDTPGIFQKQSKQ